MPKKEQPDAVFLRHVPLNRVHLFTGIQLVAIAAMVVIDYIKYINMIVPLLIVALCFLRKGVHFRLMADRIRYFISEYNMYNKLIMCLIVIEIN